MGIMQRSVMKLKGETALPLPTKPKWQPRVHRLPPSLPPVKGKGLSGKERLWANQARNQNKAALRKARLAKRRRG